MVTDELHVRQAWYMSDMILAVSDCRRRGYGGRGNAQPLLDPFTHRSPVARRRV
jgi:hypothetical protein